jgi:hypothetical protein
MNRGRRGGVVVVACLVCLALPASAAAATSAPARTLSGRFRSWLYPNSAEVLLRGTNGYRLTIFAGSIPAKKLDVYATRGEEQVNYEVPARVTRTSIRASLGKLGKIQGTFRPSRTVQRTRVSRSCTSNRPPLISARLAAFVGTISFRGEEGFTEASPAADQAPPRTKAECDGLLRDEAQGGDGSNEVSLLAAGQVSGQQPLFAASQAPIVQLWPLPPPPAATSGSFGVFANSTVGQMTIERVIQVPAAPGQFVFDSGFASAEVTPPTPFSGSASFQRGAGDSTTWSGDLSAEIPGLGAVPLAGPGFRAALGKGSELVTVTGAGG